MASFYEWYARNAPINRINAKITGMEWDWNSYESMQRYSYVPFWGKIAQTRMQEMEYNENRRYWSDYARNRGLNLDDFTYPIRSGVYGRYAGGFGYSKPVFDATERVASLYRRW